MAYLPYSYMEQDVWSVLVQLNYEGVARITLCCIRATVLIPMGFSSVSCSLLTVH